MKIKTVLKLEQTASLKAKGLPAPESHDGECCVVCLSYLGTKIDSYIGLAHEQCVEVLGTELEAVTGRCSACGHSQASVGHQ